MVGGFAGRELKENIFRSPVDPEYFFVRDHDRDGNFLSTLDEKNFSRVWLSRISIAMENFWLAKIFTIPDAQNAWRVLRYALTGFQFGFRTLPSEDPTRRPSDPAGGGEVRIDGESRK